MKKNLLVVFGGMGMEYYAGCKSFGSAIGKISEDAYNVIKLGITPSGEWILTEAPSIDIEDGDAWMKHNSNKQVIITPCKGKSLIVYQENGKPITVDVDVVFPLIAGYGGEDGRLQGMLDVAGIPYVGSGMVASACGMDKELTNLFAEKVGLDLPQYDIVKKTQFQSNNCDYDLPDGMVFPVYVKPANGGTSVGVARATSKSEMIEAIKAAFEFDDKNIIEQEIQGTEIKVSVVGNDELEFGAICEIVMPKGQVNDYETKQQHVSKKNIPADLPKAVYEEILESTEKIYKKLGCRGFARVDFFLTSDNKVVFNEINTVPGLGEGSIFADMFAKKGVKYETLLLKIIDTAFI